MCLDHWPMFETVCNGTVYTGDWKNFVSKRNHDLSVVNREVKLVIVAKICVWCCFTMSTDTAVYKNYLSQLWWIVSLFRIWQTEHGGLAMVGDVDLRRVLLPGFTITLHRRIAVSQRDLAGRNRKYSCLVGLCTSFMHPAYHCKKHLRNKLLYYY